MFNMVEEMTGEDPIARGSTSGLSEEDRSSTDEELSDSTESDDSKEGRKCQPIVLEQSSNSSTYVITGKNFVRFHLDKPYSEETTSEPFNKKNQFQRLLDRFNQCLKDYEDINKSHQKPQIDAKKKIIIGRIYTNLAKTSEYQLLDYWHNSTLLESLASFAKLEKTNNSYNFKAIVTLAWLREMKNQAGHRPFKELLQNAPEGTLAKQALEFSLLRLTGVILKRKFFSYTSSAYKSVYKFLYLGSNNTYHPVCLAIEPKPAQISISTILNDLEKRISAIRISSAWSFFLSPLANRKIAIIQDLKLRIEKEFSNENNVRNEMPISKESTKLLNGIINTWQRQKDYKYDYKTNFKVLNQCRFISVPQTKSLQMFFKITDSLKKVPKLDSTKVLSHTFSKTP